MNFGNPQSRTKLILPRAILFDMDGTLTTPTLDFNLIKREMGIPGGGIVEALAAMDPVRRAAAEKILHRHEDIAAQNATLNPGCQELLALLVSRRIKLAVITRNSRENAMKVCQRFAIPIETILGRNCCVTKPAPDALLLACQRLEVSPSEAWMVGDGEYDVEAGLAAGMRTIWLSHGEEKWFEAVPDQEVRDLWELRAMLVEITEPQMNTDEHR